MAGVTGVVMTLSLILMISSATELIRFAFNCLKLTFFKLFEGFCIDEGAVFLTQLLILCICHWSLWTKIFLLRAAVVYFWSETLIQKFMSQQLKSLQKVLYEVSLSDVVFNIFFYAGDPTLRLFGSLTICLLSSLAALLCMALGNYSFYCVSNYIINEKFKKLLSDMK